MCSCCVKSLVADAYSLRRLCLLSVFKCRSVLQKALMQTFWAVSTERTAAHDSAVPVHLLWRTIESSSRMSGSC